MISFHRPDVSSSASGKNTASSSMTSTLLPYSSENRDTAAGMWKHKIEKCRLDLPVGGKLRAIACDLMRNALRAVGIRRPNLPCGKRNDACNNGSRDCANSQSGLTPPVLRYRPPVPSRASQKPSRNGKLVIVRVFGCHLESFHQYERPQILAGAMQARLYG